MQLVPLSQASIIMVNAMTRRGFEPPRVYRCGPWKSFEAVEFATLKWVDWFNHRRILEPIGNIPPVEAEENYYAALDKTAKAA